MAKMKGPEEFFEAFRTASQRPRPSRREPDQPSTTPPAKPVDLDTERVVPAPQEIGVPPGPSSDQTPQASRGKTPCLVSTEDEPTITIRRSTLIFALVVIAVLLFIAYALGKRAGRPVQAQPTSQSMRREGLIERGRPAIPEKLRDRWAACVQVLDHTHPANVANARTYCEFFNAAPETRFLRDAGKQAFIISQDQKLHVYVGPFDLPDGPDVEILLPRLRQLAHQGVKKFTGASLEYLGNYRYAKLID